VVQTIRELELRFQLGKGTASNYDKAPVLGS